MAALCAVAQWPVVLRTDGFRPPTAAELSAARRALRPAIAETIGLLRGGGVVLVFPEGYPNVDPNPNPKEGIDAWLPFRPGFVQIAQLAQGDGATRVPIVPAGFSYEQSTAPGKAWRVVLRFGRPVHVEGNVERATVVAEVESRVRALSDRRPR
jgi:putative membrane protein